MSAKQGSSKDLKNEDHIILKKVETLETILIYTTKEGEAYWRLEDIVIIFKVINQARIISLP